MLDMVLVPSDYKQVNVWKDKCANNVGEALRLWSFVGRNNETGCYETFDIAKFFKSIKEGIYYNRAIAKIHPEFLTALNCYIYKQPRIKDRYFNIEPMIVVMAWEWDGDGCLYFRILKKGYDIEVINTDCKKDYEWEFINEKRGK